jgi:hypothetical protein
MAAFSLSTIAQITWHRMDNVALGKYGMGMFAGEACQ